jgi:hypothetical protein
MVSNGYSVRKLVLWFERLAVMVLDTYVRVYVHADLLVRSTAGRVPCVRIFQMCPPNVRACVCVCACVCV